ncbi:alpha/beta hydrolase [Burkholderia sp. BKH01]|uniref:alpha/beta hydrolase n=1 Tax=Burkholderia sp. BKH01 TaxID=2769262 RepID=UPI0021DFEFA7|nr:alpha/beta hydrolase [Burkholderia sp. BKH01]MCU9956564.1 alpha/beta hydrolase [Burkholderia sp. BKH01]
MNNGLNDGGRHEHVVMHPLDPDDAVIVAAMRTGMRAMKGARLGVEARDAFDATMENVQRRGDVTFAFDTVGGVPGYWVFPAHVRSGDALLHLHGGWFNFGSAAAFRHFVAQLAARVGVRAFIPDYRLAPEHPFPAAIDDVLACYRGLAEKGIRRIVVTGDSAGGALALGLASRVAADAVRADTTLAGVAALSPVTDLTLSGATYDTRADADPLFTRTQVSDLVHAYLGAADPMNPLASPLYARVAGLPAVRIHVGDDEVLLDDSRRWVERAVAAGVDARLDVWHGMSHGFAGAIGKLKASAQALDAIGLFLAEQLQADGARHVGSRSDA